MTATTVKILYTAYRRTTGLSDVLITIKNAAGSTVVNGVAMTELANGDYYYDYTPVSAGYHTWYADSTSQPSPDSGTFLSDYEASTSVSVTSGDLATTQQLARFLNIEGQIPSLEPAGSARAREEVGTGDGSNLLFYFDYPRVLAGTYTLYYGATESAAIATPLTETTHYSVNKNTGTITLTTAGRTLLSTNKIFAEYSYCLYDITDTQLQEALDRAEAEIEHECNSVWADGTATTPTWGFVENEDHSAKRYSRRAYYTRKGPIPNIKTQIASTVAASDTTINVDSTAGFPSSGIIGLGIDKIQYTGKTSTTFTGCTGVDNTHAVDDWVYPYVIEISLSSSGDTPSWSVLEPPSEVYLRDTGLIYFHKLERARFDVTFNDSLMGVANRVRISYIYGYDSIPAEIQRLVLMIAAKDLIHGSLRRSLINGQSVDGRNIVDIDEEWIRKTIDEHKVYISSSV